MKNKKLTKALRVAFVNLTLENMLNSKNNACFAIDFELIETASNGDKQKAQAIKDEFFDALVDFAALTFNRLDGEERKVITYSFQELTGVDSFDFWDHIETGMKKAFYETKESPLQTISQAMQEALNKGMDKEAAYKMLQSLGKQGNLLETLS